MITEGCTVKRSCNALCAKSILSTIITIACPIRDLVTQSARFAIYSASSPDVQRARAANGARVPDPGSNPGFQPFEASDAGCRPCWPCAARGLATAVLSVLVARVGDEQLMAMTAFFAFNRWH